MKKLLNEAMNELMVRVENEIKATRLEMQLVTTKGLKTQLANDAKENIIKLFNKIDYLTMQATMQFEENENQELVDKARKFKYNTMIQIEDLYNIANDKFINTKEYNEEEIEEDEWEVDYYNDGENTYKA